MEKTLQDILAENVRAGMIEKYGKENQTKLVSESHIGSGGISRILGTEEQPRGSSVGLKVIKKIADTFNVPPWILLFPKASSLFRKEDREKFLEICHSWSVANEEGRGIMLTAAAIAKTKAKESASKGEPREAINASSNAR